MSDTPDVAALAHAIEAHDGSAVATLSTLADRCLVDERNRSLFDVAIAADNTEVIALLAADSRAVEFAAPIDARSKDSIRCMVTMTDIEYPIAELEKALQQSFGEHLSLGRTPLHTACRQGHADALDTLLGVGANTNVKDVIGLTAPELSFYAYGEQGLNRLLLAAERNNRSALPVGKRLLRETFTFPDAMERLLAIAKLDVHARRLLFCYRCAWLDIDAVNTMLSDGHDPNKGLTASINPLWEACTSALLWDETIPGGLDMAYHFTKHWGHPGASSVSFDNALLNEDGSNFGQLFAEAERKQKDQIKRVETMTIDPDVEQEVVARRIAMLDVLFNAGADPRLARKKLDFGTFDDLNGMQLGDVASRLKHRSRADNRPKKPTPAASTFWELAGETCLNAEYWSNEGAGVLRFILHNVYGPVDGISLSVRQSQGTTAPQKKWQALKAVRETIDVDGEILRRVTDHAEAIYGETPWEVTYELPLEKGRDANAVWIRLQHDDDALCGELDVWVFSKD